MGFQHTDLHAPTPVHTYHSTDRTDTDRTPSQLMLEETWSMGCFTRGILAVGAAATDPHSCWWRWRCCCYCVPARLGAELHKARLGVEHKKLALPCPAYNHFTAADGSKIKSRTMKTFEVRIVLHKKHQRLADMIRNGESMRMGCCTWYCWCRSELLVFEVEVMLLLCHLSLSKAWLRVN